MKKIKMFLAAIFFMLCIVPISTTQAMPRQTQGNNNFASSASNVILHVFNQNEIRNVVTELNNPLPKDNILTSVMQELPEIMLAQGDKSTITDSHEGENPYVKRRGNNNPYVKRRGYGRSHMGDTVVVEDDDNGKDDGALDDGENDEGDVDDEDDEVPDDGSAIKYNKDLKNSSGYNEDL